MQLPDAAGLLTDAQQRQHLGNDQQPEQVPEGCNETSQQQAKGGYLNS
jgi:hypothetical protein